MNSLNNKQRKFLEFLKNEHKCIGFDQTIPKMLKHGSYDYSTMRAILQEWHRFIFDPHDALYQGYGVPHTMCETWCGQEFYCG